MSNHDYKAICVMTGKMVYGAYHKHLPFTPNPIGGQVSEKDYKHLIIQDDFSDWSMPRGMRVVEIDPTTLCKATSLRDKNGKRIYQKDITELEVDGEVRRFVVDIKTVEREVVSHHSFDDPTAKVAITGVVFQWGGFDLFPCVDEEGTLDNEKMTIVGNVIEQSLIES